MKKNDAFFVLVLLLVILALILVAVNIHTLFPTPSPQAFAQSLAKQGLATNLTTQGVGQVLVPMR